MKSFIKTLILLFVFTGTSAQTAVRLDSLFNALYSYGQINGNVVAAEGGKIIYQKSFGLADYRNQVPNGPDSRFTLASISKVFTSAAVLQLKERGKLNLGDPFGKYFRDFPFPQITIRHLLSHTSGLPDYDLFEDMIEKYPDTLLYNRDIIPALRKSGIKLRFTPGDRWDYSNLNYCLLALLVEKVSGMTFEKYITRNIFLPAKMNNTYLSYGDKDIKDKNRTINYDYPTIYAEKLEPVDSIKKFRWRLFNVNGFIGQGNIITTTVDMFRFDQALYEGNILRSETMKEAFTPVILNDGQKTDADVGIGKAAYGLGWFIFENQSAGKIVFHTGGVPGAVTIFLRNITKHQAVIILDNAISPGIYRNGINALNILDMKKVNPVRKSLTRDYCLAMIHQGPDAGMVKLMQLRADSLHYVLKENEINELGLRLYYEADIQGHKEIGTEILKVNTLLFSNGYNTYDSYGEVLADQGKTAQAIWLYKKSIDLNPGNEGGIQALKKLMR